MARFTGFVCDRHDCNNTAQGSGKDANQTPYGWPRVNIITDGETTAREGELVFCGNTCATLFFATRVVEIDEGSLTKILRQGGLIGKDAVKYPRSDEARARMAAAQFTKAHNEGRHDSELRVGCPLCDAATS